MRILLLMNCFVLALWSLSHFYFCHFSVYYKTHIPTIAIVEGVISLSYATSPVPFQLMCDSGITEFEGNAGILPTILPEFNITVFDPGSKLKDGFRIGIPFWLLSLLLIIGTTVAAGKSGSEQGSDGKADLALS